MKQTILLGMFFIPILSFSINPINVTNQTIKVGLNETIYYGFAKGDVIEFEFEVIKGKPLKSIEISAYPSSTRFSDYEVKNVDKQTIQVNETGIYEFKLKGRLRKSICKVIINRIPESEATKDFDTGIDFITTYDTVYIETGGTTRKIVSQDTSIISITDRIERVDAGKSVSIDLYLPKTYSKKDISTEVISWAYWIGTGDEAQRSFANSQKEFLNNHVSTVSQISPLGGLALGLFSMFYNPPSGDNIKYELTTFYNGKTYLLSNGNSIVSYGRNDRLKKGGFRVSLYNDNSFDDVNTNIKVSAVVVTKKYATSNDASPLIIPTTYPVMKGNF